MLGIGGRCCRERQEDSGCLVSAGEVVGRYMRRDARGRLSRLLGEGVVKGLEDPGQRVDADCTPLASNVIIKTHERLMTYDQATLRQPNPYLPSDAPC